METKETEFIFTERTNKNQCFDKRLIKYIVALAEQGVPRRDLVLEYGMTKGTLTEWLKKYGSFGIGRRVYSPAEKRSVIRAVAAGMSAEQAHITFNISSASLVRDWIREFKEDNAELSVIKPIEVVKKTAETSEELELKALKRALEEANLKIRALDTMIDIAEEQLKIDIRKKSGARQSSK
jgi:transposase